MVRICLDVHRHFMIQRKNCLAVSITKEIVKSAPVAVENYLHAGSAMMKWATTQWIGSFMLYSWIVSIDRACYADYEFMSGNWLFMLICRKATSEMMCMRCLKIQPVGPVCTTSSCGGFLMAKYYCNICKFFDDERYNFVRTSILLVFSILLPKLDECQLCWWANLDLVKKIDF